MWSPKLSLGRRTVIKFEIFHSLCLSERTNIPSIFRLLIQPFSSASKLCSQKKKLNTWAPLKQNSSTTGDTRLQAKSICNFRVVAWGKKNTNAISPQTKQASGSQGWRLICHLPFKEAGFCATLCKKCSQTKLCGEIKKPGLQSGPFLLKIAPGLGVWMLSQGDNFFFLPQKIYY